MGEAESISDQLASFMNELNKRQQEMETRLEARLTEFANQFRELGMRPRRQGGAGGDAGDGSGEDVAAGNGIAADSVAAGEEADAIGDTS